METTLVATILGILTAAGVPAADPYTYQVRHDHLLGSCAGTLVFEETQLRFNSSKDHSFVLPYLEVQQLGLFPRRVDLLTWKDQPILFGKDQLLHFELLGGEIDWETVRFVGARLARPLVTSVLPEFKARYVLPAKHRGFFRGAEGRLALGDEGIAFQSAEEDRSRFWRWKDVSGYGSTGPFQLRVSVMERTGGEAGEIRNFVFLLKQPLPPEVLDLFWAKVHGPRIAARESVEAALSPATDQ
jgi:hypothetical protein